MFRPNLLKAAIVRAGFTQGDFAQKIGISQNTLTSRMTGETSFDIDEVDKAREILDMSDSEILSIFFSDDSLKRETN